MQLHNCERCGFTYKRSALVRDQGLLVCKSCKDDADTYVPHINLSSPRASSTSVSPVSSPTVFTISTAGVLSLTGSFDTTADVLQAKSTTMYIVGDGDVIVTGDPAVVAGSSGQLLCLVGTSDVCPVTFITGCGLELQASAKLSKYKVLNLVFDSVKNLWVETSRGDIYA